MNKRKTLSCGIDIAAPGGVDALLNFHRKTFGDAVMTAGPGEPEPTPTDPPKPAPPAPPAPKEGEADPEGLGDAGKRALQAIRQERDEANRRAAEAQRQLDEKNRAEMSDLEKARADAEREKQEAEKLRNANLRLTAIADHSVPKKYQHLVHGTDEASFAQSAKDVAELAAAAEGKTPPPPGPDPVPGAGGGHSGDQGQRGSSVSAGAEEYDRRNKKSNK